MTPLVTHAQAMAAVEGERSRHLLFRMNTTTPLRLHTGAFDLPVAQDPIETSAAAVYSGIGAFQGVGEISSLFNGRADRLDFSMSGEVVDDDLATLLLDSFDDWRHTRINIGLVVLDAANAPLMPTIWLTEVFADTLGVSSGSSSPDGGGAPEVSRTIRLSAGTETAARAMGGSAIFSHASQSRRNGDQFAINMARYRAGITKKWGPR